MADSKLSIYLKSGSCSFVAHALLKHLGVPFTPIWMRNNGKRHYEAADGSFTYEDYCKLNPSGYVPIIALDGGEIITELPAILTYIACLAPPEVTQKMLGDQPLERAKVVEWMTWMSGTFLMSGVAAHWRSYRFADGDAAQEAVSKKGWETVLKCFERAESLLDGREFAVGTELSVVDIYLYLFRRWADDMDDMEKRPFEEMYPNFDKLARKVEALQSVQDALADESSKPLYS